MFERYITDMCQHHTKHQRYFSEQNILKPNKQMHAHNDIQQLVKEMDDIFNKYIKS